MDWWFHWLFALLFYNDSLDLKWFLIGNVILDIFFIISFISVAGVRPRSLTETLKFDQKAGKTIWHKIGFALHSIWAVFIFLGLSFIPVLAIKSLCYGLILHLLIDLAVHKGQPNPIFYPFSDKRYASGFMTWDLRNKRITIPALQLLCVLFLLKYLLFGLMF